MIFKLVLEFFILALLEKTGGPTSIETSFPDNSGLPQPKADALVVKR